MKKNLLLCLIILIIIRNIMTREEFKAEMAEKKKELKPESIQLSKCLLT